MFDLKKTDSEIQKDVTRELNWDTRVSPTEVGVQVSKGVVTLSGTVDSWAKVRAAEKAAHRVVGVLDVANDLSVKLPGTISKTDTDIAQAVRHALEWDSLIPEKQVKTTVSHGIVTLEGQVSYWTQKLDAERAVERLAGVKAVINQIEVQPKDHVNLDEARKAVEKALERHAEREAERIDLHATDGEVNVTGIVHTWQEKEAVLGAVRGTRGVRSVTDHLRIQTHA